MCWYVSIHDGLLPDVLEVTQAHGLESACKESRWGLRMQLKSPAPHGKGIGKEDATG